MDVRFNQIMESASQRNGSDGCKTIAQVYLYVTSSDAPQHIRLSKAMTLEPRSGGGVWTLRHADSRDELSVLWGLFWFFRHEKYVWFDGLDEIE